MTSWKGFAAGCEEHVAGSGVTSALPSSEDLNQTPSAGFLHKSGMLQLWMYETV